MSTNKKDPTDPIRLKASRYAGVDEGTACTQSSFKAGKKAFLYIGMQGGRYKAMFKLDKSKQEAAKLAKKDPDCYEVGSTTWVTARFTTEKPMPTKLWQKWLDESYGLTGADSGEKKSTRRSASISSKSSPIKKPTKKKTTSKKTVSKKTATKAKSRAKRK